MIVNTCAKAARINKENNLPDYNSTDSSACYDETYPQFVENAGDLSFKSKVLSQNPAKPSYYREFQDTLSYFTMRL